MAKRKNRKSKTTAVTDVAVDKLDRGTLQTRARISPDPLLSPTLEPHRAAAGLEIRAALEEGFGAQGLDIVRIGMGGGASSSHHHRTPVFQRLLELRSWRDTWHRDGARKNIPLVFAEQFALGNSIRQIAQHHVLSRHKVAGLVCSSDRAPPRQTDLRRHVGGEARDVSQGLQVIGRSSVEMIPQRLQPRRHLSLREWYRS